MLCKTTSVGQRLLTDPEAFLCVLMSCSWAASAALVLCIQWWKTAGSQSLRLTIACNTTMNCAVRLIKQTYPFPFLFIPFYISTSKSSTWLSLECSESTTSFTTYQSKINLSLLRSFAIPLPPVEGPKSVSESSLGLSISLSICLPFQTVLKSGRTIQPPALAMFSLKWLGTK